MLEPENPPTDFKTIDKQKRAIDFRLRREREMKRNEYRIVKEERDREPLNES